MSSLQETLQPNEQILFATDRSLFFESKSLCYLFGMIGLYIYFVDGKTLFSALTLFLVLAVIFITFFLITRTLSVTYVVTNSRLMSQTGFLSTDETNMSLGSIESVKITQTIIGHLLDYGDVTIFGTGGLEMYMRFAKKPGHLNRVIMNTMMAYKNIAKA